MKRYYSRVCIQYSLVNQPVFSGLPLPRAHAQSGKKRAGSRDYIQYCIQYCKKLDQSVHNSRADWLPANPECGVSPPQGNGQALEQVTDRFSWRYAQSLTLYIWPMLETVSIASLLKAPSVSAARGMKWTPTAWQASAWPSSSLLQQSMHVLGC